MEKHKQIPTYNFYSLGFLKKVWVAKNHDVIKGKKNNVQIEFKKGLQIHICNFILFFGLKSRQNLLKCNGLIRQLLIVYILVA